MNSWIPSATGDRWVAPACYDAPVLAPPLAWRRLLHDASNGAGATASARRKAYGVRPRPRAAELEQLLARLVVAPKQGGVPDRSHAVARAFRSDPVA